VNAEFAEGGNKKGESIFIMTYNIKTVLKYVVAAKVRFLEFGKFSNKILS
jgi:hypothetical protein